MTWTFEYKKPSTKYGRPVPARVEARKTFAKNRDHANVLVVVYADGRTTVSMNGPAPMNAVDIVGMADALETARRELKNNV